MLVVWRGVFLGWEAGGKVGVRFELISIAVFSGVFRVFNGSLGVVVVVRGEEVIWGLRLYYIDKEVRVNVFIFGRRRVV